MRALVLAGGFAKRMWPLTLEKPKQLLPLSDGYVVLDLVVDGLLSAELDEIILSVNRRFAGQFEEWASSRGLKVRIEAEQALREEEKPGAAGALARLVSSGSLRPDDYLVLAGDNVSSVNYSDLASEFRSRGSPMVAVYDVGDRELARKYGVVELGRDGRIIRLVEKPRKPRSTLVSTAIYSLTWEAISSAIEYASSGAPTDAIGHFISWLASRTPVYAYRFTGFWYDVGGLEEYERVKGMFSAGLIPRPKRVAPPQVGL